MTYWLLKLHRWLALLFALPLAVLIVTGLILSVEPSLTVAATQPGTLTVARIEAALATGFLVATTGASTATKAVAELKPRYR